MFSFPTAYNKREKPEGEKGRERVVDPADFSEPSLFEGEGLPDDLREKGVLVAGEFADLEKTGGGKFAEKAKKAFVGLSILVALSGAFNIPTAEAGSTKRQQKQALKSFENLAQIFGRDLAKNIEKRTGGKAVLGALFKVGIEALSESIEEVVIDGKKEKEEGK